MYHKETMRGHIWKEFSHIHQSDIVVNNKDSVLVLCKLKEFLPRQTINLNLRAHSEEHIEE
jgi:hypothetical protein